MEQGLRPLSQYPAGHLPFQDTIPDFPEVLSNLGRTIDLISCPYQTSYWGDRYCSFQLKDPPMCVARSKNHRLTGKKLLAIEDLYGEKLLLERRGVTPYIDKV